MMLRRILRSFKNSGVSSKSPSSKKQKIKGVKEPLKFVTRPLTRLYAQYIHKGVHRNTQLDFNQMKKRSLYYESGSDTEEDEGVEIPSDLEDDSNFGGKKSSKASSLSARFKAIEKFDKEDYTPSDESYDSEEEIQALSDSEDYSATKLASPITPFNKKQQAKAKKLIESDSDEEIEPIKKPAIKKPVSVPLKPVVSKPAVQKPAPIEKKAPAIAFATEATPKPLKPVKRTDYSSLNTPNLKARLASALNSDDDDDEFDGLVSKKITLDDDDDELVGKMKKLSIANKKTAPVSMKPEQKKAKTISAPLLDESDEEIEVPKKKKLVKKPEDKENNAKKGNKGEKKPKDPNAPKRPVSAFFFYSKARRATLKEENPDLSVTDIAKALGEEWKELDESDKKRYNKQAEKDKQRYEAEMTQYKKTLKA